MAALHLDRLHSAGRFRHIDLVSDRGEVENKKKRRTVTERVKAATAIK